VNEGVGTIEPCFPAILELQPTHFAVCFDAKGKTFRHEMFTDYKANRPPTPPELLEVIPGVIDMVQRMGVPLLMMSGVEADDIIGTIVGPLYKLDPVDP
jgi:DNA polymerase-1